MKNITKQYILFLFILGLTIPINAQQTYITGVSDLTQLSKTELLLTAYSNSTTDSSNSWVDLNLISGSTLEKTKTLRISGKNSPYIKALSPVVKDKVIFLPLVSYSIEDNSDIFNISVFKIKQQGDSLVLTSQNLKIDKLYGKVSSASFYSDGSSFYLNYALNENKKWITKTLVISADLEVVDKFSRTFSNSFQDLKVVNILSKSLFVADNNVFNLSNEIKNDPLWNKKNVIIDYAVNDGNLVLLTTSPTSTDLVVVNPSCKIETTTKLSDVEVWSGKLSPAPYHINAALNFKKPIEENGKNYLNESIKISNNYDILSRSVHDSSNIYPFLFDMFQGEESQIFIYKEVISSSASERIGYKIIRSYIEPESKNNLSVEKSVLVYPNPTKDIISTTFDLDSDGYVKFTLTDLNGKPVYSKELQGSVGINTITIETNGIRCGTYFIALTTNEKTFLKKIFILD